MLVQLFLGPAVVCLYGAFAFFFLTNYFLSAGGGGVCFFIYREIILLNITINLKVK